MTIREAMELIANEKRCVTRAETCDRDCGRCDLLRDSEDIKEAFDIALNALLLAEITIGRDDVHDK